MTADRGLAGEILLHEFFIDHCNRSARSGVLLSDWAAFEHTGPDRGEIVRPDAHRNARVFVRVPPCHRDPFFPILAAHRRVLGISDRPDSRNPLQAFADLMIESVELFDLVSGHLRIELDNVAALRFEAKMLVAQLVQALQHQPGGADQYQRERRLQNHQRTLNPVTPGIRSPVGPATSARQARCRTEILRPWMRRRQIPIPARTESCRWERNGSEMPDAG